MSLQWFKFYGAEYLADPKISSMTPQERSCWITLLCLASAASEIGKIEYLTTDALLKQSGIQWDPYDTSEYDNLQGVLQKFERMKMIKLSPEGIVTVINWNKRQQHNLTVAERVAKSRAKKKSVTMNVTSVTPDKIRLDKIRLNKEENTSETSSQLPVKKEEKKKYGEFENVLLTDGEMDKLYQKIGDKNTHIIIEELSGYIASKGKRYSSHYATLLGWARRKVEHHVEKESTKRRIV